jgi:hypothetical protein
VFLLKRLGFLWVYDNCMVDIWSKHICSGRHLPANTIARTFARKIFVLRYICSEDIWSLIHSPGYICLDCIWPKIFWENVFQANAIRIKFQAYFMRANVFRANVIRANVFRTKFLGQMYVRVNVLRAKISAGLCLTANVFRANVKKPFWIYWYWYMRPFNT